MTRRDVVGVARLVGLLAIGEAEAHLPLDNVAPARKLGAVVRQPAEQVREVGVGRVRLEANRVASVEVLKPDVESLQGDPLGRRLPGYVRHLSLLSRSWTDRGPFRASGRARAGIPTAAR